MKNTQIRENRDLDWKIHNILFGKTKGWALVSLTPGGPIIRSEGEWEGFNDHLEPVYIENCVCDLIEEGEEDRRLFNHSVFCYKLVPQYTTWGYMGEIISILKKRNIFVSIMSTDEDQWIVVSYYHDRPSGRYRVSTDEGFDNIEEVPVLLNNLVVKLSNEGLLDNPQVSS